MQAVERLGFTPNAISKSLRTLRTGKLIVTVPDIANPFFSLILKGIEDAAQREGYNVLVGDTQHEEEREERYAEMLKRKEADGRILLRLVEASPPQGRKQGADRVFVGMNGDFSIESGAVAASRLLARREPPTAI